MGIIVVHPRARCAEDECESVRLRDSDWCAHHACRCSLCSTPVADGEDFCRPHAAELSLALGRRIRYAVDLTIDEIGMVRARFGLPPL